MHSPENLHQYKNIVVNDNLNKELKLIEHQALKENDKLIIKPESGPKEVKYEHTLSQRRLVKMLCKELKI